MRVIAVKMSEDKAAIRVAYEKNGKTFIRSGTDGYATGRLAQGLSSNGFRKVENPPEFRDGDDLRQNIHKFQLNNTGTIKYYT